MHRICTSLANNGYAVTLVGRRLNHSSSLTKQNFRQKRIRCLFNKGFLFYAEYNIRLFFFLLAQKMDGICAIDLDTILPCYFISRLKGIKRVYDAHEFFTELKEVRTRKRVQQVWTAIERFCLPEFPHGYTVSEGLEREFKKRYNNQYSIIRNIPRLNTTVQKKEASQRFILYQGAVNEGRGFEYLVPAMKHVRYPLVVCGDGNFMEQLKALITENSVENKILLKGMLEPAALQQIAAEATLGINLVEKEGLNQYYSLANKFFDYIHACLPQLTMNYPEYRSINDQYNIAVLINDLLADEIAAVLNRTMENKALLQQLSQNCMLARTQLNWEAEEQKLISFYRKHFPLPATE